MHRTAPKSLTQQDIDGAVLHTLQTKDLPSPSAKAAASVQGAVVHVQSYVADPKNKDQDKESGVGTDVVIKDDGTILTNFHVIAGAKKLKVTFLTAPRLKQQLLLCNPIKTWP